MIAYRLPFEDGMTEKVITGVGTFTVAADGTITFVPEASFTGEAQRSQSNEWI